MSDVETAEAPAELERSAGRRIPAARDFGIVMFLVGIFAALAISAISALVPAVSAARAPIVESLTHTG